MVTTPYTEWIGDDDHGRIRKIRSCWVRLDALMIRAPDAPRRTVVDGLDMTGAVAGRLTGWFQALTGEWLAIVDFEVPYADGRRHVALVDQLVPEYAIHPRDA